MTKPATKSALKSRSATSRSMQASLQTNVLKAINEDVLENHNNQRKSQIVSVSGRFNSQKDEQLNDVRLLKAYLTSGAFKSNSIFKKKKTIPDGTSLELAKKLYGYTAPEAANYTATGS